MNSRKVFILAVILMNFCLLCFGQTSSEKSNEYFINGISTREDIGGVEVSTVWGAPGFARLEFENYNNFVVTVIFEITQTNGRKITGTIVLKAYEKKKSNDSYAEPVSFTLIVRKLSK